MIKGSRVLVTGATGFIGQRLCRTLVEQGFIVRQAIRRPPRQDGDECGGPFESVVIGEINETTDWSDGLRDVSGVIHLAGRAHVMREHHADTLSVYRQVNVAGTSALAKAAIGSGVKRFVFVSSIKVNGESSDDRFFTASDPPAPKDAYGRSKWEAEQELQRIATDTKLEVAIVRPPLVYGPGVKGNLLKLMHWVERGLPLPLGACKNMRSLIGLDNLVDLLVRCISDQRAVGQIFLAGDGEDMSSSELVRRLARAMKKKPSLIAVPPALLRLSARTVRKQGLYDRLCGSLRVDSGHAREVLGWTPPSSVDEELLRMTEWFLRRRA